MLSFPLLFTSLFTVVGPTVGSKGRSGARSPGRDRGPPQVGDVRAAPGALSNTSLSLTGRRSARDGGRRGLPATQGKPKGKVKILFIYLRPGTPLDLSLRSVGLRYSPRLLFFCSDSARGRLVLPVPVLFRCLLQEPSGTRASLLRPVSINTVAQKSGTVGLFVLEVICRDYSLLRAPTDPN